MMQMIVFLFELVAAGQKLDKIGIRDNDRPEGVATFVITNEEKRRFLKQPLTLRRKYN